MAPLVEMVTTFQGINFPLSCSAFFTANSIPPQQESGKLTYIITQIPENGTGKVTTDTGYRFDKDGLWISKSGEEMENKLDHTGMYVRRSGQLILQANNRGVEAADVTVRNYLTVGQFARLEDYQTNRTACFYIGGTNDGI